MNTNPVIIIDDDSDDQSFIKDAWKELKYTNELITFRNGEDALKFLEAQDIVPFLVLCDVNLPKINGFELKEKLMSHPSTRYSSIPFVFWSSPLSNAQKQKAYDLGVNGIFVKENSFEGLKNSLQNMMNYWTKSNVPE